MSEPNNGIRLGFIGTGLMGFPMAQRLLYSGYKLKVYNRTRRKALPLEKIGAQIVDEPGKVFTGTQAVILMLTDAPAIEEVLQTIDFGKDIPGRTIFQMGTILPEENLFLADKIKKSGGFYLEAPVLGSLPEARAGELIIMAGGDESDFSKWRSLLQAMGNRIYYIGETGAASALKLALNQLIASLTAAFSLSLGMVRRRNIDVDLFMQILQNSALYAPTFLKKLPRYRERDFRNPNFPVKHLLKDVDLIVREAEHLGLDTGAISAVRRIIEKTIAAGFADSDYSAVYNMISPEIQEN